MIKGTLNKVISPFVVAWGRTPVVWPYPSPQSDLDRFRQIASKHFNPNWNKGRAAILSKIMYPYMLAIWPFRALYIIANGLLTHGDKTKKLYQISHIRQLIAQLKIAFIYQSNPDSYYQFELFTSDLLSQTKSFFLGNSVSAVLALLNDQKQDLDLEDKKVFNAIMRKHNFPVVEDLMTIEHQSKDPQIIDWELPEYDFIAKPNQGCQGQGIYRFEWLGDGQYYCSDGNRYSSETAKLKLNELSSAVPYLIQPRLLNHPDLADLSPKGFCTCRIISGISPDGNVEIVRAIYKMPCGEGVADNLAAGGVGSPIDLSTGKLGSAVRKKCVTPTHNNHPDTGAEITGRILPHWQDIVELVSAAHPTLPGYVFLGWDIGITENGPVILEANDNWCALLAQRPFKQGLGNSPFLSISQQWLEG